MENKVVETIDRVQDVIQEFFTLMCSMKQSYPPETAASMEDIKDLVVENKVKLHKLESSLSEPNLHSSPDLKISKGFEEISVIIKERIMEDDSEDEKEVEDSSTEFETFINAMSKEKKSVEELMSENTHLSKMVLLFLHSSKK